MLIYLLSLFTFYIPDISPQDKVILYIFIFSVCFFLCSVLYFRNRRKTDIGFREVLIIAAALRAALLFSAPVTSDDYYRYLWDGKVQSEGIDPFLFSPLELTSLHDNVIYPGVTFPEVKTIYPPVSQIIFYLAYQISPGNTFGLKLLYLLFDIGTMIFLSASVLKLKLNPAGILLYAFSPLVILEFFLNAHVDVILIFFLSGSLYFTLKRNIQPALLFLGFSVLSKTYSLIFLPVIILFFVRDKLSFTKAVKNIICFILPFTVVIFYREGIMNLFQVMGNYMKHWYNNNLIYKSVLYVTEMFGVNDHALTREILIILFAVSFLIILFSRTDLIKTVTFITIFYFLFSHTVHPWYLTVLAMLLPLYFSHASFYWTGIIGLTNLTVFFYLKYGIWDDALPVLIIEYAGVIIFLLYDFRKIKLNKPEIITQ